MFADGFREAGVLTAVFGMLDKLVQAVGADGPLGRSRLDRQLDLLRDRRHARKAEKAMSSSQWISIAGLLVWGIVMATAGFIASERERRAHRREHGGA